MRGSCLHGSGASVTISGGFLKATAAQEDFEGHYLFGVEKAEADLDELAKTELVKVKKDYENVEVRFSIEGQPTGTR